MRLLRLNAAILSSLIVIAINARTKKSISPIYSIRTSDVECPSCIVGIFLIAYSCIKRYSASEALTKIKLCCCFLLTRRLGKLIFCFFFFFKSCPLNLSQRTSFLRSAKFQAIPNSAWSPVGTWYMVYYKCMGNKMLSLYPQDLHNPSPG